MGSSMRVGREDDPRWGVTTCIRVTKLRKCGKGVQIKKYLRVKNTYSK